MFSCPRELNLEQNGESIGVLQRNLSIDHLLRPCECLGCGGKGVGGANWSSGALQKVLDYTLDSSSEHLE